MLVINNKNLKNMWNKIVENPGGSICIISIIGLLVFSLINKYNKSKIIYPTVVDIRDIMMFLEIETKGAINRENLRDKRFGKQQEQSFYRKFVFWSYNRFCNENGWMEAQSLQDQATHMNRQRTTIYNSITALQGHIDTYKEVDDRVERLYEKLDKYLYSKYGFN